jgi:hypothetical protein
MSLEMESIERQLIERLEVGKKRYGHGIIVNSDTKEWGTPSDSWIDMCVEELLDAVFYIIADYIRKGRESDKSICELELEYKINDDFVNAPDPVKYLLETHDEDDNALIIYIVRNYSKIESPKHKMLVWNLLNMLLVCSQF